MSESKQDLFLKIVFDNFDIDESKNKKIKLIDIWEIVKKSDDYKKLRTREQMRPYIRTKFYIWISTNNLFSVIHDTNYNQKVVLGLSRKQ